MDLWVLAGQSNMVGAAAMRGAGKADSRIKLFNLDNKWIPAQEPIHRLFEAEAPVYRDLFLTKNVGVTPEHFDQFRAMSLKKPLGTVGPGLFFARHLARYIPDQIGLIPCAYGATGMADWSPDTKAKGGHSLYATMIERMRLAGGNIKGVLWYQGESDAMSDATAQAYEPTFMRFMDAVRKDSGQPDLPFLTVQISRFALDYSLQAVGWEQVREAQRQACHHAKNLLMTSAIDLELGDAIHISYEAQQQLGKRFGEIALSKVYGKHGHGTPIDLKGVERMEPVGGMQRLRVRFTGVSGALKAPGRATGFTLRSKKPDMGGPTVLRVELDRKEPSSVVVWYSPAITEPVSLYYGAGINPFVNVVDEKDMPVPAFGPVPV